MGYGVFRIEKLKGGAVYGKNRENNRKESDEGKFRTSDIDWSRTKNNIFIRRCDNWDNEADRQIREHVHQKKAIRKDAVRILDAIFTCSPEEIEQLQKKNQMMEFFNDCLAWYEDHYGRVINAVIHLDEKTPHMHVQSIPITKDGRLSASELVGNKKKMSSAQQDVEDTVFRKYGLLHRNIREAGQAKKHKQKAEWLAEEAEKKVEVLRKEDTEYEKKKNEHVEKASEHQGTKDEIQKIEKLAYHSIPISAPIVGKIGDESYSLPPHAFHRLLTLAKVGNDAMVEVSTLRDERDAAERKAAASQKKVTETNEQLERVERTHHQMIAELQKKGATYFQAPQYAKDQFENMRQYHLAYCEDVDRGIVAAYCTARQSDGIAGTYNQRLEVASKYASQYISVIYDGVVTKGTARKYAENCIKECRRQASGHAPSPSSDGWHHKIKQTDFSLPPETGAVPLRVPIGDDRDDDDMGTKNWNLMSEFEKEELMMRELMRSI